MNKTKTGKEISKFEMEAIEAENRKAMLFPLRMIAFITVISGLFALIFEVQYFKNASIFVYAFRFFALTIAFWILILTGFEFGKRSTYLLAHVLLFSIIMSFAAVIIYIPQTLIINSQVAALTIFTSTIFLTWEIKNQIVVSIYYNLIFGATLILNLNGIYFIPNIFAAVIFILFLSVLSIAAVSIISKFRQEAIIKTVRLIETQKINLASIENAKVNSALFEISSAAYTSNTLDSLFSRIHIILEGVISARNFFIALIDESGENLIFPYEVDDSPPDQFPVQISLKDSQSLTVEVILSRKPLLLDEEELNERYANGKNRLWRTKLINPFPYKMISL